MENKKQQGLTTISWLVLLAVLGVLLTAAFKLGPIYLDNYFVRASIDSLDNEDVTKMTDSQIRRKISSFFHINNVRNVNSKQVKIVREKTRMKVSLNYEKRVGFMGNIDFVVMFTNEYDSLNK